MALTKIGKEGITGISNSSDANAITIDSSENVGIGLSSNIDRKLHVEVDNTYAAKFGGTAGGDFAIEIGQTGTNGSAGFNATGTGGAMKFSISGSERMRITSEGYLTQSKLPMFNIIGGSHTIAATGQTTITSSNGFTSSTEYDPDSLFDHSNGRFTAPVAGRYFFIFSIGIIFTSGYHYTYLFKNGASMASLNRNITQNTQFEVQSIQAVLNLASGDYVTAERNNNNVSGSVDGAMFSGFLLG
jgi:hypothetical protein